MRILHLWFFLRTLRGARFFFKGVKLIFPNFIFWTFWCQKWIQRRILSDHGAFFRHSGHFKQNSASWTGQTKRFHEATFFTALQKLAFNFNPLRINFMLIIIHQNIRQDIIFNFENCFSIFVTLKLVNFWKAVFD